MSKSPEEIKIALSVLRAQGHDSQALAELVQLSHKMLLAYAARLLNDWSSAEEVMQDVWIAIVRGIGSLGDPALFKFWAFRIIGCECANWVKRLQRIRRDGTDQALLSVAREPAPPADHDAVRQAMSALSVSHREALTLHYFEGLTIQEIAGLLGTNEGTIKSRLHYAREQLRITLGGSSHD